MMIPLFVALANDVFRYAVTVVSLVTNVYADNVRAFAQVVHSQQVSPTVRHKYRSTDYKKHNFLVVELAEGNGQSVHETISYLQRGLGWFVCLKTPTSYTRG
jgi:hypothetical protein